MASFDSIPHDLLLKALRKHTQCPWVLLYVERWLKAPMQREDGVIEPRDAGTPQGGVTSPILADLQPVALEQRFVAAAVGIGRYLRQALALRADAIEIDLDPGARLALCGIQDMRGQASHSVRSNPRVRRQTVPLSAIFGRYQGIIAPSLV